MARKNEALNEKSIKDLLKLTADNEKKLLDIKMELAQGKTKNTHSGQKIRKEIARVKTALKERELGSK